MIYAAMVGYVVKGRVHFSNPSSSPSAGVCRSSSLVGIRSRNMFGPCESSMAGMVRVSVEMKVWQFGMGCWFKQLFMVCYWLG